MNKSSILNNENLKSLLNQINQYSKITEIDFENDSILLSDKLNKKNNEIPETLEINKITNLNGNSNPLTTLKLLKEILLLNTSIKYFNFSWQKATIKKLNEENQKEFFENLNEILLNNNSIFNYNFSYNDFGNFPKFNKILIPGLLKNNSITKLDLSYNSFNKDLDFMKSFGEVLLKSKNILDLDLTANLEICKILLSSLSSNSSITKLNLDNSLGFNLEITQLLGEMIIKNQTILDLDLSINEFGNNLETTQILIESLSQNNKI